MSDPIIITIAGHAGVGKSSMAHLIGAVLEAAGLGNIQVELDPSVQPIPNDQIELRLDAMAARQLDITIREEHLAKPSANTVRSRP